MDLCSTAQVLLILPVIVSDGREPSLLLFIEVCGACLGAVLLCMLQCLLRLFVSSRTHGESVACRHTDADTPRHVHISPGTHFSWKVHTSVLGSICCTASPGRVIEAPSPDPEKRNNSGSCQVRSAAFRDEGTKSRRCPAHCSSYVV